MTQRRFPPPWTVEELACFIVRDDTDQTPQRGKIFNMIGGDDDW